jgi:hypothetical protein
VPPGTAQGRAVPGGVAHAQTFFWEKVLLLVEDFIPSIEQRLPDYRRAWGTHAPPGNALEILRWAEEEVDLSGGVEHADASWADLYPLARSLRQWGERWHLLDSWCLETALHTCHAWCYEGSIEELPADSRSAQARYDRPPHLCHRGRDGIPFPADVPRLELDEGAMVGISYAGTERA